MRLIELDHEYNSLQDSMIMDRREEYRDALHAKFVDGETTQLRFQELFGKTITLFETPGAKKEAG